MKHAMLCLLCLLALAPFAGAQTEEDCATKPWPAPSQEWLDAAVGAVRTWEAPPPFPEFPAGCYAWSYPSGYVKVITGSFFQCRATWALSPESSALPPVPIPGGGGLFYTSRIHAGTLPTSCAGAPGCTSCGATVSVTTQVEYTAALGWHVVLAPQTSGCIPASACS